MTKAAAPPALDEKDTGRLEAFSDGVFAIAITLLVLELKTPSPSEELGPALLRDWPSYAAFLTSFATIGIMWMNHHALFRLVHRVDHTLLLLNGLVLLGATVVPFPTALVAAHLGHPGGRLAAALYSGVFLLVGVAYQFLWRYASSRRRQPAMLGVPFDNPAVMAIHASYAVGPVGYVAALLLAFWSAGASLALNLLLALWFALPHGRRAEIATESSG